MLEIWPRICHTWTSKRALKLSSKRIVFTWSSHTQTHTVYSAPSWESLAYGNVRATHCIQKGNWTLRLEQRCRPVCGNVRTSMCVKAKQFKLTLNKLVASIHSSHMRNQFAILLLLLLFIALRLGECYDYIKSKKLNKAEQNTECTDHDHDQIMAIKTKEKLSDSNTHTHTHTYRRARSKRDTANVKSSGTKKKPTRYSRSPFYSRFSCPLWVLRISRRTHAFENGLFTLFARPPHHVSYSGLCYV